MIRIKRNYVIHLRFIWFYLHKYIKAISVHHLINLHNLYSFHFEYGYHGYSYSLMHLWHLRKWDKGVKNCLGSLSVPTSIAMAYHLVAQFHASLQKLRKQEKLIKRIKMDRINTWLNFTNSALLSRLVISWSVGGSLNINVATPYIKLYIF